MNSKEYNCGQIIFKENAVEAYMYKIERGCVGIYTAYGTPQEKQVGELSGGEILGERGLLENAPRSATAVALEDGTLLTQIGEDGLKEYFLKEPEKILLLMRNVSARLREMNNKLADVCRSIYECENA